LVRAVALPGTVPAPWKVVIVGSGSEEFALKKLAQKLRIGDLVEWHDTTDDPDAYYRRASILVLPSRHEGTPNVLIEGMGHGLVPIVTDASPGPRELVENGVSGLVVPSEDAEALASAVRQLISDEALRLRLSATARKRIAPYALDNVLAEWEAVLLLDRHRSDPDGHADGSHATTVAPS
jgi:glycosyltransferase involved in cell wall biosynthesis